MAGFGSGNVQINDYVVVHNKTSKACKLINVDSLSSATALCKAFGKTALGVYQRGDMLLWRRPNGQCYLDSIDWGKFGGNFTCDSLKSCFKSSWLCDSIKKCVYSTTFCDSVKKCVFTGAFCDSVEVCLDKINLGDKFCGIIKAYSKGILMTGDSVLGIQNGVCKLMKVNTGSGGSILFKDSTCIAFDTLGGIIKAYPKISGDDNNGLECRDDGLYASSICPDGLQTTQLQANANDYFYILRGDPSTCYRAQVCVTQTPCVGLDIDQGCFRPVLNFSTTPGNIASCDNGVYVPNLCTAISMSKTGFSDGSNLANGDIVLTKNCQFKTFNSNSLCSVFNAMGTCDGATCSGYLLFINNGSCCKISVHDLKALINACP